MFHHALVIPDSYGTSRNDAGSRRSRTVTIEMIEFFDCGGRPIPGLIPSASFDHLVGAGEERGRDREAEGVGGFEVDHELKLCRLDYRQFGWFLASENSTSVSSNLLIAIKQARAIAHQAARFRKLPPGIDRGQTIASREHGKKLASSSEKGVCGDQKGVGVPFSHDRKGLLDLVICAGL